MTTFHYLHLVKAKWSWSAHTPTYGYGRDSGGDNQLQSVPQQKAVIEEFVTHHGLNFQGFFGDPAKLSSTIENREQLQKMLNELLTRFPVIPDMYKREKLRDTPRAVVLSWKINRITRDDDYADYVRAELAMRAILIVELAEDPSTGNKLVDGITQKAKQFFNRQQLDEISTNARRGQAENLALCDDNPEFRRYNPDWPTNEGRYIAAADGKPPKGFKGIRVQVGIKRKKDKDSALGEMIGPRIIQCLVVDETVWARCHLAWEMRHNQHSIPEIHRVTRLYPTLKGYSAFFKNRIYTGDYWHSGVLYECFVPALIPLEWYEAEQARRTERAKKKKGEPMASELEPRRVASTSLLSGRVKCETVPGEQHSMHAHRSPANMHRTKWNAYECSVRKQSSGEKCPFYGISQPALDKAVVDVILRDVITRENLRPMVDALNVQLASQHTIYNAHLEQLDVQIAEAEKQRRKYHTLIKDDDDPSPGLAAEYKHYEREKNALLEQKRQLTASGPAATKSEPVTDAQLDDYIARMRDVLMGGDEVLARRILEHFVDHVSVRKGSKTGTLYYTFPVDIFFVPELSSLRTPALEGFRVRTARRFNDRPGCSRDAANPQL